MTYMFNLIPTALLADVFEGFRVKCLEIHELDPSKTKREMN